MPFDIEEVLRKLSNKEKIALLSGSDFWHTYPIPEHNVPPIRFSDGPNGIRGTKWFASVPACCIPCGTALGATWDKALVKRAGELLGAESIAKGTHCWLGPTVNIQRSPLGGRGFESFSEDSHLSGVLASAMIRGCESTGVTACVKHFVGNDQEHERRAVDVLVTERALREVYLRPFQIVARDAKPGAMMTSYNKVNGTHVSENPRLLDIVQSEWGWSPMIMSDWYGTYSTSEAIKAGLDLEMPGATRYRGSYVEFAMSARIIKQSTLDSRARKVLGFVEHASKLKVAAEEGRRNLPADRALNRELCGSSIVLMKNDGNVLPLPSKMKKLALIGSHMKTPAITGGGSASLEPYYKVSAYDAILKKLKGSDIEVIYAVGAYAHKVLPTIERHLSNGRLHFYNEPSSVKDRKRLSTEPIIATNFQLMDYKAPGLNKQLFYASFEGDFIPDTSGLWDFGLTVFGTGDLYIDDELVIDNTTTQRKGDAFFGKGTMEERGSRKLVKGKVYKLRLEYGSAATTKTTDIGVVSFGGGAAQIGAALSVDPEEEIETAVKAVTEADHAVLCTGLNDNWESEGFDRKHMDLPPGVDKMIARVLAANPRTVIVNQSGTPVTMPWAPSAQCIVQAWYGGSETGNGIADVLFGDVNPSAKLSLSWPKDVRDNPAYLSFESVGGRVLYSEDVYAGWKYYEKIEKEVLFPFGHGLSYTTFSLSSLKITSPTPNTFVASVTIKNTGLVAGSEVIQIYVSAPNSSTPRPAKELHGFEKVYLEPGQEKRGNIEIDAYATSFWDEIEECWKSEKGTYTVMVGTSSRDIVLQGTIEIEETRLWLGL